MMLAGIDALDGNACNYTDANAIIYPDEDFCLLLFV